eukprot:1389550-Pyramimonas_sp.AAC.1
MATHPALSAATRRASTRQQQRVLHLLSRHRGRMLSGDDPPCCTDAQVHAENERAVPVAQA